MNPLKKNKIKTCNLRGHRRTYYTFTLIMVVILSFFMISGIFDFPSLRIDSLELKSKPVTSSVTIMPDWNRTWGGINDDYGENMVIDEYGDIYVVGTTYSFGIGYCDVCLVKYNNLGDQLWNTTWGGESYDTAQAVVTDSLGNIYITGYTSSYGAGANDFFLLKYNQSGSFQWYRTFGGSVNELGRRIALDSFGNIYILGTTTSFGSGSRDVCLVKYNNSGNQEWYRTWGGSSLENAYALIIDSQNNIYLGGETYIYRSTYSIYDLFLIKYNSSGNLLWTEILDASERDVCRSLAFDSNEDIICGGNMDTRSGPQTRYHLLMLKYDKDGNQLWNNTWGPADAVPIDTMVLDSSDNIYIGFRSSGSYMVKFNKTGYYEWDLLWGIKKGDPNLDNQIRAIRIDSLDILYIAGSEYNMSGNAWELSITKYHDTLFAVSINSSHPENLFGSTPPQFNITIFEPGIDTTWYSLNGGRDFAFTGTTGTINQTEWDSCDEGLIFINFYANHSLGYTESHGIQVIKDTLVPVIDILKPLPDQPFGNSIIEFELNITEANLISTWYNLNDGNNITVNGPNGTIDQVSWNQCEIGPVKLSFFVSDIAENIISQEIFLNHTDSLFGYLKIIHIDNNWSAAEAALDYVQWDSVFSKYVIENVSIDCKGNPFGIFIENSKTWDFEIRNCTVYNAGSYAIRIYNTWSGIIEDCHLFDNDDGISIESGSIAIVVQDCVIENNDVYGVYLESSNFNTVRRSNLTSNNVGIRVIMSDSLNVLDNNISNSNGNGLHFYVSDDCRIEGNDINHNTGSGYVNGGGIYWEGGTNNVIKENEISHNKAGIYFTGTSGTNFLGISYNNVTFNSRAGISVMDGSFANTVNIRYNNVSGNNQRGIQVFWARGTTIDDNYVDGNGDDGITVAVDHDTMVSDNFVSNNDGYGIWHPDEYSPRESLTFYNNTVSGNSDYNIYISSFDDHATYPGSFTYNTIIGNIALDERTAVYNPNAWNFNYYSYYSGEDANDDGIGDTAQDLYNPTLTIQDQNPAWWDSPTISITSPVTDDVINATAPSISYVVSRGTEDTIWYNLNDGTAQTQNYTYLGSIIQTAWDQMSDGNVWIRIYVNDTMGWENYDEVRVIKDIIGFPRISITGINEGDLFGKPTPGSISLEVIDPDGVDELWYRLENSTYSTDNYTWQGYVEQIVWDLLSNGSVTIFFYANDSLNHVSSKQVTVRKDIFPPNIQITDPNPMELFSFVTPAVNVSIADINGISDSWYQLYNTTYTTTGTTWTGAIDPLKWAELYSGTVTIRLWTNDSVGNVAFDEVTVRKDITAPLLTINSPLTGEKFDGTAPSFSLLVTDSNLHSIWYTIDQGINNVSCSLTGNIEQNLWLAQSDGPVTIVFYANDTLGNSNSAQISVLKDTIAPKITIISPVLNQNFPTIAPTFIIEVDEVNLDTMWYTIDGGLTNITFLTNESIDQTEWTAKTDGPITLVFYANDTYGRVNFSSMIIIKDIVAPTINLITPILNQQFGGLSPNFIVEIFDTNLNAMWYTVDGGLTNFTFISNGSIDQTAWTALSDGTITIYFYANDLAGNEMHVQVDIEKDTVVPIISINAPTLSEFFSTNSPSFDITIDEINLDAMWYTIDNGITNISFTGLSGIIDQTAWIAAPDGQINIRFYANDTAGNENFMEVAVNKDLVPPVITIIAPETDQVYQDYPSGYEIEIDEANLESFWYTIDGGINNITITELTDSIDITAWNNAAEGPVTIQFYARDLAGNIGTSSVTIIKDLSGYEPPPSPGIPGYNLIALIGVTLTVTLILTKRKLKK